MSKTREPHKNVDRAFAQYKSRRFLNAGLNRVDRNFPKTVAFDRPDWTDRRQGEVAGGAGADWGNWQETNQ